MYKSEIVVYGKLKKIVLIIYFENPREWFIRPMDGSPSFTINYWDFFLHVRPASLLAIELYG